MEKRPINTLFMLMSLDGKINSGDSDELDVDRDWCKIDGVVIDSETTIKQPWATLIVKGYKEYE